MIITRLSGGLGNQMFQYAFGRQLAERNQATLKLDLGFFDKQPKDNKRHVFRTYDLPVLNIQATLASPTEILQLSRRFRNDILEKGINKLFGYKKTYLKEPHFHFSEKAYTAPDNRYVDGYWQSAKYFSGIENIIREEFTFAKPANELVQSMLNKIRDSNSVCVNVRRADFAANPFHGFYGAEYFKKGEAVLREKISGYTIYVFSDEIDWCRDNLQFDAPTIFVSHEYAGEKFSDYLRLMSACKHYIIPNSSFAWWAVWLNQIKEKFVIAPAKWFNDPGLNTSDLISPDWIKI